MSSSPARRMRRAKSSPESPPMRTHNGHVLLPQGGPPPEVQALLQQVALQTAQQVARVNDTQLVAQIASTLMAGDFAAGDATASPVLTSDKAVEVAVEIVARSVLAMQPDAQGNNALSRALDRLRAAG